MSRTLIALAVLNSVALSSVASQGRTEITVWTARAIATVLAEVGFEFERTTGHRLNVTSGLSSDFARRVAAGDAFDVMVSGLGVVQEFIRDGKIDATTRTVIARSGIGVEVRSGARKPDVSSVEAFKRALLETKSIAYLRVGSGFYLDTLLQRLGIAESIKSKVTRPEDGVDRQAYTAAKNPYIWAIMSRADRWSQDVGWHAGPSGA
ncbi:MAG: substrate-binding domain-containing protein [Gemmatimonadaceae bacterium]